MIFCQCFGSIIYTTTVSVSLTLAELWAVLYSCPNCSFSARKNYSSKERTNPFMRFEKLKTSQNKEKEPTNEEKNRRIRRKSRRIRNKSRRVPMTFASLRYQLASLRYQASMGNPAPVHRQLLHHLSRPIDLYPSPTQSKKGIASADLLPATDNNKRTVPIILICVTSRT